jgi:hypothetical protein
LTFGFKVWDPMGRPVVNPGTDLRARVRKVVWTTLGSLRPTTGSGHPKKFRTVAGLVGARR